MQLTTTALLAALATTTFATTIATVGTETFVFKWGKLISGVPTALPTTHLSRSRVQSPGHVVTEVMTTTATAYATETVHVQSRGLKEFWSSFKKEEADSLKHLGKEIEQDLHLGHHARDVTEDGVADEDEDPIFGDQAADGDDDDE